MWVVLFACLAPSPNDSQSAEGAPETDTADSGSQIDDSEQVENDDTPTDDSAVVRGEDTGTPGTDTADTAAPGACDWMSWDTVGQPYFKTWCTACHSANLDEAKRQGAPLNCNLDTYEDVVAWAPAIQAKLMAGTMPPTGTPPQDIESAVLEWLDCGAPQ